MRSVPRPLVDDGFVLAGICLAPMDAQAEIPPVGQHAVDVGLAPPASEVRRFAFLAGMVMRLHRSARCVAHIGLVMLSASAGVRERRSEFHGAIRKAPP